MTSTKKRRKPGERKREVDAKRLVELIGNVCLTNGGTVNADSGVSHRHEWALPTACGLLSVSVFPEDPSSVYGRFDDVTAAVSHPVIGRDVNRFSGKWNLHCDSSHAPDYVAEYWAMLVMAVLPCLRHA